MFSEVNSSKPVSANTARMYKQHLNKIAKETGCTTVEALIANPDIVIQTITNLTADIKDKEKQSYARRVKYCAIFWALHGSEFTKQPDNPYRRAFHLADPKSTVDGTPWKKSYAFTD